MYRDFLGVILGIGIKWEKVGDIVVIGERGVDVMVLFEMVEFLSMVLILVWMVKVEVCEVDVLELKVFELKVEDIFFFEFSTRLDVFGSAGFRMLRLKFVVYVEFGDVKVNWKEVKKGWYDLSVGDVVLCCGKGCLEVVDI